MHPAEIATLSPDAPVSAGESQFYVFEVRGRELAFPATALHRVVRATWIMPVPGSPPGIAGGINVGGQFVPVIDLGPLLQVGGPILEQPHPNDHFVLLDHGGRSVAVWAQRVCGFVSSPPQMSTALGKESKPFQSLQTDQGLVLVCDLDLLLSPDNVPLTPGAGKTTGDENPLERPHT